MRVGLFVPCYVDQLAPDVGLAALDLLEAQGASVAVLREPRCCGQPFYNLGRASLAEPLLARARQMFAPFEHVVCPSGSCTAMLRRHAGGPAQVYELCEFLVTVLGVETLPEVFPYRVALHQSCHALRELGLGNPSELGIGAATENRDHARRLLATVRQLSLVEPARADECCGFGGTFCVTEPEVSSAMGRDRILDYERAGAEVITSTDVSCLLHLDGILRYQRMGIRVMHVAQILAGRKPE